MAPFLPEAAAMPTNPTPALLRERSRILHMLSIHPAHWEGYARDRFREQGRGAIFLRGFCTCCGKPTVAYASLEKNETFAQALSVYAPLDELIISSGRSSDGALRLHRFTFLEMRQASARALN